jgi:hypothetical protein
MRLNMAGEEKEKVTHNPVNKWRGKKTHLISCEEESKHTVYPPVNVI